MPGSLPGPAGRPADEPKATKVSPAQHALRKRIRSMVEKAKLSLAIDEKD
jgi:hypothetical protein